MDFLWELCLESLFRDNLAQLMVEKIYFFPDFSKNLIRYSIQPFNSVRKSFSNHPTDLKMAGDSIFSMETKLNY